MELLEILNLVNYFGLTLSKSFSFELSKAICYFLWFHNGWRRGISCHGSHRIVGDSSIIAMPECSIGLVPDVGGSYLLTRKSKKLGIYLGISGQHMKADDAIFTDFADFYILKILE